MAVWRIGDVARVFAELIDDDATADGRERVCWEVVGRLPRSAVTQSPGRVVHYGRHGRACPGLIHQEGLDSRVGSRSCKVFLHAIWRKPRGKCNESIFGVPRQVALSGRIGRHKCTFVLLAQVRLQFGNEENAIRVVASFDVLCRECLDVARDGVLERDVALQSAVKRGLC